MLSVYFGSGGPTRTSAVAMAVCPPGKVACTLIRYVCAAVHAWVVVTPAPTCPSPKLHRAASTVAEPIARSVTAVPTTGLLLLTEILTVGVPAGGGAGALSGAAGCGSGDGSGDGGGDPSAPGTPSPAPFWYFPTGRTTPSSRMTPARSPSGSLKNTRPSRLSSWKRVPGERTWGRATTRDACRSTTQTWSLV